jgi:hypothetical protein
MAIVSVVRVYVDEGRFESMDFGMKIVNDGMAELVSDHKKDINNRN